MKPKPTVGQTLYSLNIGNSARGTPQVLTPVIVTKVGRKYFTVGEDWQAVEYHIENWRQKTDYSATSYLYESEKEYHDEKEAAQILDMLRDTFQYRMRAGNIPLEKLRAIRDILIQTDK